MTTDLYNDLKLAGLLDSAESPQLTDKGRSWLHALEDLGERPLIDLDEAQADLVQSTNGLFR